MTVLNPLALFFEQTRKIAGRLRAGPPVNT